MTSPLEDVWRREAPHVLAALTRRYGDFGDAEDAVQEALIAAHRQWPRDVVPGDPRAWLVRVAARRLIDQRRSDTARASREIRVQVERPAPVAVASQDDTLIMLLLCCRPILAPPAQVCLTLRAVAGLTTAQIAAGLVLPERTVAQRITRAKAAIRQLAIPLALPAPADLPGRVATAVEVLVLVFNEGYATSAGEQLVDTDLAGEAIRLLRDLHRRLPDHGEVSGALALALLTFARTAARTGDTGDLVSLAEQDRGRWDHALIAEGVDLIERALPVGPVGPLQLQAAIAAVHSGAAAAEDTDWSQIRELYRMLDAHYPNPMVTLNLAVAEGMAGTPGDGLARLNSLDDDPVMHRHHRYFAVRAHLRERAGDRPGAIADYTRAAALTASAPEQRYLLHRRAAVIAHATHPA